MLQPKLNLKVSQRQVLTPGLVQMVSVLALNKLELKEMINTEMVENPVLEEIEESGVTLDERQDREATGSVGGRNCRAGEGGEGPVRRDRLRKLLPGLPRSGFQTSSSFEDIERPSFDNFLSAPSTLERSPGVATRVDDAGAAGAVRRQSW